MAFTQAQLDAAEAAYAAGVRRFTYDGKTTEYASMAELWTAIQRMSSAIATAGGSPLPVAGYSSFRRTSG